MPHKIMFICHGNICRSTMAEFLLKALVAQRGLEDRFIIASSGVSREELGNPVHPGTVKRLKQAGVAVTHRGAIQLKATDYEQYDYLLCMDRDNLRRALTILGGDADGKVRLLTSFLGEQRDIADPWYSGDFDLTFDDISRSLEALLASLGY